MKLHASINKTMDSNVQAVSVFEFVNVNALAAYLRNRSALEVAEPKEANIATEMDDMIDLM